MIPFPCSYLNCEQAAAAAWSYWTDGAAYVTVWVWTGATAYDGAAYDVDLPRGGGPPMGVGPRGGGPPRGWAPEGVGTYKVLIRKQ